VSITVHDLHADLLGEGELNCLAGGLSKTSNALGNTNAGILNLRDGDTFILAQILTADSGKEDWFVDTGLDGLGVGDGDWGVDNSDNGDIVASLLGDLLAVVVSVSVSVASISAMAITILGRLTDSHHLGLAFLGEGNLDSLAGGLFLFWLVGVAADLIVDFLNGLCAHSAGDNIAEFFVDDDLDWKVNIVAFGDNGGGAHLCGFNYVDD